MASDRRFKVIENYRDPDGFHPRRDDQFQPREGRAYQKLRPWVICDLMERAGKSQNAAGMSNVIPPNRLYERMSNEPWTCTATAHEGGIGGGRGADPYLHFNIWFKPNQGRPQHYHVRCHEFDRGGLYVFQVTF
jgi:hypothetical protein